MNSTSAVDICVMAKLHGFEAPEYTDGNLPAVFGGQERNIPLAIPYFLEKIYKLCIRTKQYEFQLESKEFVGCRWYRGFDRCIYVYLR